MPEISVDIIVVCSCGNNLSSQVTVSSNYKENLIFIVEPCEKCLEKARDEGYEESLAEGE